MNIKEGDTVILKSGGPMMTVKFIDQSNGQQSAFCEWFDENKVVAHNFSMSSLEKVDA